MDQKKYQVFVSSTYEDLLDERQEVMQVLLEMDCIPSGMELFPAADEDQWRLIREVIDDCDYYLVIIAGRYGSVGPDGVSYTEKEYRYAVESGKPVIAFLHKDPGSIVSDRTEQTEEGKKKLEAFRELAEQKVCKQWSTPHELGSVVARSLNQLKKRHPGIGWVRGDQVLKGRGLEEILQLRKTVEDLKAKLVEARTEAPPGTEHFASGDEVFKVRIRGVYKYSFREHEGAKSVPLSWNEIFFTVSPLMIQEASETAIEQVLANKLKHHLPASQQIADSPLIPNTFKLESWYIDAESFGTIIVQLRALGLIAKSTRTRSVKDTATYWTLTPYGDHVMNDLRAITR